MLWIIALFAKLAPAAAGLWPILKSAFSGGSQIVVALVGIIPPVFETITTKPLAAFLAAAVITAPVCYGYGRQRDADLRAQQRQVAIDQANRRAELAIAAERSKARKALVQVCAKLSSKQRPAECKA